MNCSIHNVPLEEKISKTKGTKYYGHYDLVAKSMCFGADGDQVKQSTQAPVVAQKPTATLVSSLPPEPVYFDKRSFRIERQHSQDMAIRFLELLSKVTPEAFMEMKKPLKDMVKEYTDHFQSDLDSSPQAGEG